MNQEQQLELASISNVTAERAVLSIVLNKPETIFDVFSELEPRDFTNTAISYTMSAIQNLIGGKFANLHLLNVPAIVSTIEKSGLLEKFEYMGGLEFLEAVRRSVLPVESLSGFIREVKAASIRRQKYLLGEQIKQDALKEATSDVDAILASTTQKALELALSSGNGDRVVQIADGLRERIFSNREPQEIIGLRTPFPELSRQLSGLEGKKAYVIAANAKSGKSAFLLNQARVSAVEDHIGVLYIDTEMDTEQQARRIVSQIARVPERAIRNGTFQYSQDAIRRVDTAISLLENAPFYHVYLPGFKTETVLNLARKYKLRYNIGLVIFDYIKMPQNGTKRDSIEWQELGILVTALKDLAGELNVPVLTAAQLTRDAKRAEIIDDAHIGGSYRIAQYADVVMYLRQKTDKEIEKDGASNGNSVLTIGTSRQGGDYTGWIDFIKPITLMREICNISDTLGVDDALVLD